MKKNATFINVNDNNRAAANLVKVIFDVFNEVDPSGLRNNGQSSEKYQIVAEEIAADFSPKYRQLWHTVQKVLQDSLGKEVEKKLCKKAAFEIITANDFVNFYEDLRKNDTLKTCLSCKGYGELRLAVHDDFDVTVVGGIVCINGKMFDYVEDQDLEGFLCELVTDDEHVYVQFDKKPLPLLYGHRRHNFFLFVQKRTFNMKRYAKNAYVSKTFDNKEVLYERKN